MFTRLQADLSAILGQDGEDILYRRNGTEMSLKVLPYSVDCFDERIGEGDILGLLVMDEDLGTLSPPKYGDEVVFVTSQGEEVWEVMGVNFLRPDFWKLECGRRYTPRPNPPKRV